MRVLARSVVAMARGLAEQGVFSLDDNSQLAGVQVEEGEGELGQREVLLLAVRWGGE